MVVDRVQDKRGKFVDANGNVTAPPTAMDLCPIVGGPWPNQFIGAAQRRCQTCNCFVGVSPKGLNMHRENPEKRPILCPRCFELMCLLSRTCRQKPVA